MTDKVKILTKLVGMDGLSRFDELAHEVNAFVLEHPHSAVQWLQSPQGDQFTRLTAIITYRDV